MANHILTEKRGNIFWIRFNRPEKYNAISSEMYRQLIAAFDEADNDKDVLITVLTGTGKYYSAGSDFSLAEMERMSSNNGTADALYKQWVDKIIRHSKLLAALVNGPALGIAVTTLTLCDVVLASDQASFHCPFTQLGLNPEGASSYTFVQIMGYQKAARLALLAEKVSAMEALDIGFVTQVIPHASFKEETENLINKYSKLAHQNFRLALGLSAPVVQSGIVINCFRAVGPAKAFIPSKSVIVSKRLLRPQNVVDHLLTINRKEYEVLMNQFASEETVERMMSKFISKI